MAFTFLTYFFIFLFGLMIGSFLNVVICRLETKDGIVGRRSHCPKCGQVLRWRDLVPVVSFFILGRRCRYCREKISWQYPLVEIATGLLFLLIFLNNFSPFGRSPAGWQFSSFGLAPDKIFNQFLDLSISKSLIICYLLYVACSLLVIFVYDLRHYLIPDKIIYPAIVVAALFRVLEVLNFGHWNLLRIWDLGLGIWRPFLFYLLSAVGAAAFFLVIVLITRGRGMGIGDIKLAFFMGLLLGWPMILPALLVAFAGGAIVGLILVFFGRKTLKSEIPFGPFLVGATVAVIFLPFVA